MAAIKVEIQALETAYAVAQTAGDVATVLALYSEDAVTMGDDRPAVVGKAAIQKDLEEAFAKRKPGETTSFETTEVFGDENTVTEVGKAAIQKDMEADFASSRIRKTVTYQTVEVFGDENRVTETGTVIAKDSTGKVAYTEKYMAIWEKRKGRWQVIREIYNHDSKAR
jgi:ketosteroid isomerase-like protein